MGDSEAFQDTYMMCNNQIRVIGKCVVKAVQPGLGCDTVRSTCLTYTRPGVPPPALKKESCSTNPPPMEFPEHLHHLQSKSHTH
jgi:hypothetical protein